MEKPILATNAERPHSTSEIPKLSLQLLFVWVTLCAVGIVISNIGFAGMLPSLEKDIQWTYRLTQFMTGMGAAIAATQLTGMGVLAHVWRKTKRMLAEPGHWLIWIACLSMLCQLIIMFVRTLDSQIVAMEIDWTRTGWQLRQYLVSSFVLLLNVIPVGLSFFAATRHKGLWRVGFLVSMLPPLLDIAMPSLWSSIGQTAFTTTLMVGSQLVQAFPPVLIVYSAFSERLKGIQRNWIHWVGIGASAATGVMMLSYAAFNVLS